MSESNTQTTNADRIDDQARDWLLRLSEGPATKKDLANFRMWRDADPRHRAAYAEIREIWKDAAALRAAFEPISLGRPPVPVRLPICRIAILGGLIAACVALLVSVTPILTAKFRADVATAAGEQITATLPDGSRATLNTDSAIALDFTANRRRVTLLRGEAYFNVRKDAQRPFDVLARGGQATATGTAFAVRSLDGAARVTVTEGTVRVSSPVNTATYSAGAPGTVLLEAGQQARYRDGAPPRRVTHADPVAATAWRHGTIMIDNLPLSRALAEIDRYRPGRIVMLGDASREEPVTARIALDALDGGIRALAATHGLTVTEVTDYLLIVH